MSGRPVFLQLAVAAVLSIPIGLSAQDSAVGIAPLLRFAPSDTNALLLVDVGLLKQKPLAIKNGWMTPEAPAGAALYLPPDSNYVVVASELDVTDRLKPEAEVALIAMSQNANLQQVAQAEGGYIDQIGEEDVVFAPSGAYIMALPAAILAQYSPADRQAASRWLSSVLPPATPSGQLSSYLKQAVGKVGEKSPIILALDLTQALPPHAVATALANSDLKLDSKKLNDLVASITSLQGVTAAISIEDHAMRGHSIRLPQQGQQPERNRGGRVRSTARSCGGGTSSSERVEGELRRQHDDSERRPE